jgi:acyl carrier protein
MIEYNEIDASIREILKKIGPQTGVKNIENPQFTDINSITFVQLIVHLEGKYGIEFDDDILLPEEVTNFNDLVKVVQREINKLKA